MKQKQLFVIIVTHNGMKWIEECIKSVLKSSIPVSIIVVDNNSTDGTIEFIKSNFPEIIFLPQNQNLGFGKANNIGISFAMKQNTDFVFLLNQDAKIEVETIEQLLEAYYKNEEYGVLSPLHLNWEGDDIEFGFYNESLFKDLLLKNKLKEVYNEKRFINASSWLLPSKTLRTIGGFDPIFFHYGEDVNYCQRLIFHKLSLGIVTSAKIYHDATNNGKSYKIGKKEHMSINLRYFKNQTILKFANVNTKDYLDYESFKIKFFLKIFYSLFLFDFESVKINAKKYLILRSLDVKGSYFQNIKKEASYLHL